MIRLAMSACLFGALLVAPAAVRALNGHPAPLGEPIAAPSLPAASAPARAVRPALAVVDSHHTHQRAPKPKLARIKTKEATHD